MAQVSFWPKNSGGGCFGWSTPNKVRRGKARLGRADVPVGPNLQLCSNLHCIDHHFPIPRCSLRDVSQLNVSNSSRNAGNRIAIESSNEVMQVIARFLRASTRSFSGGKANVIVARPNPKELCLISCTCANIVSRRLSHCRLASQQKLLDDIKEVLNNNTCEIDMHARLTIPSAPRSCNARRQNQIWPFLRASLLRRSYASLNSAVQAS